MSVSTLVELYHRHYNHSIRVLPRLPAIRLNFVFLIFYSGLILFFGIDSITLAAPAIEPVPQGFLPPTLTLFAPSIYLAPPGSDRASRSIAMFDSQIGFYRAVLFHPDLSTDLQNLVDAMPPHESTLVRAAEFYANPDIPWTRMPDGVHVVTVAGVRSDDDYTYRSAPVDTKITPGGFIGRFALRPTGTPSTDQNPGSVVGTLGGEFLLDSYGVDGLIDVAAAALRQCYGDLHGPWDVEPGSFNRHDRAALDRIRRDMPDLSAQLHRYFRVSNVVDEFAGGPAGPDVLFNLEFQVRDGALAKFPHLEGFYTRIGPRAHVLVTVEDDASARWAIIEFDRGLIRIVFLDSAGMLRPFNAQYAAAGDPLAIAAIDRGRYHVDMSFDYTRFGLSFGLEHVSFVTDYHRNADGVRFVTHMTGPPTIVAPPVLRSVVDYLADQFLDSLAGGMSAGLTSRNLGDGRVAVSADWSAELQYSPGLEVLARVGDSIADAYNAEVRADDRRLAEERFDPVIADYRRAGPTLRALDNRSEQSGDSR